MIFSFGAALAGNYAAVGEGVQAAIEAGLQIAEMMDELMVGDTFH
jgi:hypothetical protein